MNKDNTNSEFDFESSEFSANFINNIEKVLGDSDTPTNTMAGDYAVPTEEEAEVPLEFENTEDNIQAVEDLPVMLQSDEESAAAAQPLHDMSLEDIDDELNDINSALAKQICIEMESIGEENNAQKKKWLFKIQSGIALTILCLLGIGFFLGFTKPGNNLLMGLGINLGGTIWEKVSVKFDNNSVATGDIDNIDPEDTQSTGQDVDPNTIVWANSNGVGRHEDGVYNILLLGEEAIGMNGGRGRTDEMEIATLNTKTKKIMLTSIMRDCYVQIPGFKDNKINAAYEEGGIDLVYKTIALNFGIRLDGCVKVNFEDFEKVIDKLGGVEVTLSAKEAKYLNSTNYISNPAYRHVVQGKQLLNGNQALGYARVRHVANVNGTNNDYGRTERHRMILNAIFDRYKSMSKADLVSLMFGCLPMITTDIDAKNFEGLINAYFDMGTTQIEQLRIPIDGTFQDNLKIRGMSVLVLDMPANNKILQDFIFGDGSVQSTDSSASSNSVNSTSTTNNAGN